MTPSLQFTILRPATTSTIVWTRCTGRKGPHGREQTTSGMPEVVTGAEAVNGN
jgi:hypothetical protein